MTRAEATMIERAEQAFRRTSELARVEDAPLYEHLAAGIAEDAFLLEMATHVRPTQSMPYLLFDSVQYLLLGGVQHELARYYPNLTDTPSAASSAFPVFREFCNEHAAEIRRLIETHVNQTNEIGRIAALLPVFGEVARRSGGRSLGLVEVGPSGGLLLCFDRYFIDYGRVHWGDSASTVRIHCQIEDDKTPPLEPGVPAISHRVGLDIEPIDLTDDNEARWLLSSMWPDHRDLALRQRDAIEELRRDPPRLVKGGTLEVQPLLEGVPRDLTLCVLQSFVFSHVPEEERQQFIEILAAEGRRRAVYFVSMGGDNMTDGNRRARVDLSSWVSGKYDSQKLVECHSRGRSMRWLS